jgi:hypothetical protein
MKPLPVVRTVFIKVLPVTAKRSQTLKVNPDAQTVIIEVLTVTAKGLAGPVELLKSVPMVITRMKKLANAKRWIKNHLLVTSRVRLQVVLVQRKRQMR